METVCQKGWVVSVTTGGDIKGAKLQVFRKINNKIYHGSHYGQIFPSSKAAWAWC